MSSGKSVNNQLRVRSEVEEEGRKPGGSRGQVQPLELPHHLVTFSLPPWKLTRLSRRMALPSGTRTQSRCSSLSPYSVCHGKSLVRCWATFEETMQFADVGKVTPKNRPLPVSAWIRGGRILTYRPEFKFGCVHEGFRNMVEEHSARVATGEWNGDRT